MYRESLPVALRYFVVPDHERVKERHTVLAGAGELEPGMVLAQDSGNSNKLVPVDSQSGTTSVQEAFGVLATIANAAASDAEATVFVKGYFFASGLNFGGTDTVNTHRTELRKRGIYIKTELEIEHER